MAGGERRRRRRLGFGAGCGEAARVGRVSGAAPNEIRVRASSPPAAALGLYTAWAANGPAVFCWPCHAARRAEARPATCRGPARARFQPCQAVLGPGRIAVPRVVPQTHGLHAHL